MGSEQRWSAQDHLAQRGELEAAIEAGGEATELAVLHLQLGHLLRNQFLEGVTALRHFQEAFKLDSERLDAVGAARAVYRELGRLPLVQKLINIEISSVEDVEQAAQLYLELGDVLMDLGDFENAALAYTEAQKGGASAEEQLEDAQIREAEWQSRVSDLIQQAGEKGGKAGARFLARAAIIVRKFDQAEGSVLLVGG